MQAFRFEAFCAPRTFAKGLEMRRLLLCVVVSGMLSGCAAGGSYNPHMCCEISVLADTVIIAGAALLLRGAIRGSSTRERVSVH